MEIQTIQPFLQYFGNVRERTMRAARCIPAERIDWSYAAGKFTLGDLLRHIAVTERYMFAECVRGNPSRYTRSPWTFLQASATRICRRGVARPAAQPLQRGSGCAR
jgi:DinB superfamily